MVWKQGSRTHPLKAGLTRTVKYTASSQAAPQNAGPGIAACPFLTQRLTLGRVLALLMLSGTAGGRVFRYNLNAFSQGFWRPAKSYEEAMAARTLSTSRSSAVCSCREWSERGLGSGR